MNQLMEIPWILIFGMLGIFAGVFWATRKELLKRNEEHEIGFLLEEVSTRGGFEITVEGTVWWRTPQGGDSYQKYLQLGKEKTAERTRDEVKSWLMAEVGNVQLAEAKSHLASVTRTCGGLDLSNVPVHPKIRVLLDRVDMKDSDARALAVKAVQRLRAEGVKEALEVLKTTGLSPRVAANTLTTLQAVESAGGQISALMTRLSDIVEVHNE